jgi:hypothetical protein
LNKKSQRPEAATAAAAAAAAVVVQELSILSLKLDVMSSSILIN